MLGFMSDFVPPFQANKMVRGESGGAVWGKRWPFEGETSNSQYIRVLNSEHPSLLRRAVPLAAVYFCRILHIQT
jgi:hypothetical protein